jgi:hypothetical protein
VFANALDWRVLKYGGDAEAVILCRSFQNVRQLRDRGATHARSKTSFV